MVNANVTVKTITLPKRYYSWNPSKCICGNNKHLKSIVGDSVIVCDEIINIIDKNK